MHKWLNKQKIGSRITIGFGFLIAIMGFTSFIALGAFITTIKGISEYQGLTKNNIIISHMDSNLNLMRMRVKDYMINRSDEFKNAVYTQQQLIETDRKKINQSILDARQIESLNQFDQNLKAYIEHFNELITLQDAIKTNIDVQLKTEGEDARLLMNKMSDSAKLLKDDLGAFLAGQLRQHLLLGRMYTMEYIGNGAPLALTNAKREVTEEMAPFQETAKKLKQPELIELVNNFNIKITNYRSYLTQLAEQLDSRNSLFNQELSTHGNGLSNDIADIRNLANKRQHSIGQKGTIVSRTSLILLICLTLGAIALGLTAAVWLSRNISKPLIRATDQLSNASTQVAAASEQISSASSDLSAGATRQSASIEQSSATMEEMGAQSHQNAQASKTILYSVNEIAGLIEQNAQKALEAAQISELSKQSAERGETSIHDISNSMNEIRQGSEQITNIISTINDIAQQTKMLAVNAAIEAARAGEHGLGFAVVADQVSKLAETSKTAAKEIENLIRESVHKSETGALFATKGTDAIQEILNRIQNISEIISHITASSQQAAEYIQYIKNQTEAIVEATEQEAMAINQMSDALRQIEQVTQQNSSGAEETASAATELNAQSKGLIEIVDKLNAMVTGNENMDSDLTEPERFNDTARLIARAARIKTKKLAQTLQTKTRRPLPDDTAFHTPHPNTASAVSPEDLIPMRADFSDFQEDPTLSIHQNKML